jgi:hypothetical protein
MLSESARMSSPAEARFRVQAPNSKPRSIKVIALDAPSEHVVRRLAEASWQHATFFTTASFAGAPPGDQRVSTQGCLSDLGGHTRDLMDEVYTADLVVMVATAGGDAHAASIIGEACSLRRVMTTALIIGGTSASDEALSRTLAPLRPWALMVVIAHSDDYIEDMLIALRA